LVVENMTGTAGLSNFAIQYNYVCASVSTAMMLFKDGSIGGADEVAYPQPEWAKVWMLSLIFSGSVVGMSTMGIVGDLVGTRRALILTNSLTAVGALSSALLSWGDSETIWEVIAVSRFVLGIGVGGNYPLSAAMASAALRPREASAKAAAAFFWQVPGTVAPYLVGLILLCLPLTSHNVSLQFRLVLGLGALPALASVHKAMQEQGQTARGATSLDTLRKAFSKREHLRALAGTAGTWFCFDIAFYGTVIFSPSILRAIFGSQQSLTDLCGQALIMGVLTISASVVGVAMLMAHGAKRMCVWGLASASVIFAMLACLMRAHPNDAQAALFALLCALYIVLYMGPGLAMKVLPVVAFPEDVRGSFHGVTSAAAKVGALGGSLLFPEVNEHFGVTGVMALQSSTCLLGCLLCLTLVEDLGQAPENQVDEGDKPCTSWRA